MVNLISENWQALLGVLGSVIAFFGGRKLKKQKRQKVQAMHLHRCKQLMTRG